jgi:hypothetical protein
MARWVRGKSIEGRTRRVLARRSISLVRRPLKVWKSVIVEFTAICREDCFAGRRP